MIEEENTLSIIKPDAIEKNLIGKICAKIEDSGLRIVASKMVCISIKQAETFYKIHANRPFYGDLVKYMTSGRVLIQVLRGIDAVKKNREIMGATDPKIASIGSIRHEYGESIERNIIHGSDSIENAIKEIQFFFSSIEIFD